MAARLLDSIEPGQVPDKIRARFKSEAAVNITVAGIDLVPTRDVQATRCLYISTSSFAQTQCAALKLCLDALVRACFALYKFATERNVKY